MLLSGVLERLGEEGYAAEALLALEDLPLMLRVEAAGRPFGETVGQYACGAARRFAQLASGDDWLALLTALEHARDPGSACLKHMLEWSLRRDAEAPADGCGGSCTCAAT